MPDENLFVTTLEAIGKFRSPLDRQQLCPSISLLVDGDDRYALPLQIAQIPPLYARACLPLGKGNERGGT